LEAAIGIEPMNKGFAVRIGGRVFSQPLIPPMVSVQMDLVVSTEVMPTVLLRRKGVLETKPTPTLLP
jgi:hypothetical protein